MTVLRGLIWSGEVVLGVLVAYLLVLTLVALLARRRLRQLPEPKTRFAVLIPAHNEERLLPETLASLSAQKYPKSLYQVYVIADNCTDRTVLLARIAGVVVYERFNSQLIGKGHALNTLMAHLEAEKRPYDAVVIVDADTKVAPDFLGVMDGYLQQGARAVQGYYTVRSPEISWNIGLRCVALAALHYLRPLGRCRLGGSAGLKGNGMVLVADLARRFPWSGSVTEDIECHMALLLAGERVWFAPEARLEAEMPGTFRAARSQNVRWEQGRLQMARRYVGPLLMAAGRQRRFAPLDAVLEHLIPPTAVLTALILVLLGSGVGLGLGTGDWRAAWGGVGLLAGEILYLTAGLILIRAPLAVWLALVYVPVFLVWKVGLYVRILAGRERQGWIRTER